MVYLADVSRFHSYLHTTQAILTQYRGETPFAYFIRNWFGASRKYGSRDRRVISNLCYCFFRTGQWGKNLSVGERILGGLFLCSETADEVLSQLRPEWNEQVHLPLPQKMKLVNCLPEAVFPWIFEISNQLQSDAFVLSHFIQPDLFLRLRPGWEEQVTAILRHSNILFSREGNCVRLPNGTAVEELLELDRMAVVQDKSSQRLGEFYLEADQGLAHGSYSAWDCCAASGGKSILVHDINPAARLTVSDIRKSILVNLKKRFAKAGIQRYHSVVADLTEQRPSDKYQLILCDAPCTGSGTWSRTPEQLAFFDVGRIRHYESLQKNILCQVAKNLANGGYLVYSTCSVFARENEEVARWAEKELKLELIRSGYFTGYQEKADTLFGALFRRSL